MVKVIRSGVIVIVFVFIRDLSAQHLSIQALKQIFTEKDTSPVIEDNIEIRSYDYSCDGLLVEAIMFMPATQGRLPAILFIPGFAKTARRKQLYGKDRLSCRWRSSIARC